jgi:hypothetical protein
VCVVGGGVSQDNGQEGHNLDEQKNECQKPLDEGTKKRTNEKRMKMYRLVMTLRFICLRVGAHDTLTNGTAHLGPLPNN